MFRVMEEERYPLPGACLVPPMKSRCTSTSSTCRRHLYSLSQTGPKGTLFPATWRVSPTQYPPSFHCECCIRRGGYPPRFAPCPSPTLLPPSLVGTGMPVGQNIHYQWLVKKNHPTPAPACTVCPYFQKPTTPPMPPNSALKIYLFVITPGKTAIAHLNIPVHVH